MSTAKTWHWKNSLSVTESWEILWLSAGCVRGSCCIASRHFCSRRRLFFLSPSPARNRDVNLPFHVPCRKAWKARDPPVSQSNSATFLPCFVSSAAHIWPDPEHCLLQEPQSSFAPRDQKYAWKFPPLLQGETEPFYSRAARQPVNTPISWAVWPYPLQMPAMRCGKRFKSITVFV